MLIKFENPKIMNDWMTQIRASSGYDSQSWMLKLGKKTSFSSNSILSDFECTVSIRVGPFTWKSFVLVRFAIIDVDTPRKVEYEVKSALAPPSAALTASKVPVSQY